MHTDVDTKHRKKRPAKKPFVIESKIWSRKTWKTWHRYATEEQRDQALTTLIDNNDSRIIQFRAKP